MAIGGDGPWSVAVMWVLTAVVLVFTLLRLYTRIVVVKSYGMDDHVYVGAFVSSRKRRSVRASKLQSVS